jgi:hypothetical protein
VGKTHNKITIESLGQDCLDVREFYHRGLLRDREVIIKPLLRWPRVVQIRTSRYRILVEHTGQFLQQVPLSWTHCHFGGFRPWFKCPCGKRVAKLYKSIGGYHCRQCFDNPRYASQTKSTKNRIGFAASRLRLRLNGIAALTEPRPERPRGMHRKTYARALRRLEAYESRLSPRQKAKPVDYPNLVHYLPPSICK